MNNGEIKKQDEIKLQEMREEYLLATEERKAELREEGGRIKNGCNLYKCSQCNKVLPDEVDHPTFCSEDCRTAYWGEETTPKRKHTLAGIQSGLKEMGEKARGENPLIALQEKINKGNIDLV